MKKLPRSNLTFFFREPIIAEQTRKINPDRIVPKKGLMRIINIKTCRSETATVRGLLATEGLGTRNGWERTTPPALASSPSHAHSSLACCFSHSALARFALCSPPRTYGAQTQRRFSNSGHLWYQCAPGRVTLVADDKHSLSLSRTHSSKVTTSTSRALEPLELERARQFSLFEFIIQTIRLQSCTNTLCFRSLRFFFFDILLCDIFGLTKSSELVHPKFFHSRFQHFIRRNFLCYIFHIESCEKIQPRRRWIFVAISIVFILQKKNLRQTESCLRV